VWFLNPEEDHIVTSGRCQQIELSVSHKATGQRNGSSRKNHRQIRSANEEALQLSEQLAELYLG